MNIKPSGQQVEKWIAEASSEGGKILDPNKLAGLAATWGASQAQQTTVKEPKLPKGDAVSCKCSVCEEWQQSTESGMVCKNGHGGVLGINVRTYTAAQMHDHFQAGVRAGMATGKQRLHVPTGWAAPKDQYAVPVLFNPYTGEPRDVRDVQSDPQGILIVPPGKVNQLAAMQGGQK